MRPGLPKIRVPLAAQVGVVAVLFVSALAALWTTGASVVARERRRSDAKVLLDTTGAQLAVRGTECIAAIGEFPDFPEDPSRAALARELTSQARQVLTENDVEGGYFVARYKGFFGTIVRPEKATRKNRVEKATTTALDPPALSHANPELPPLEADLIDIQVDAAMRKRQVLFSVEELNGARPVTVAIRTAPLSVGNRVIGATWVMTRLLDPLFVDRSLQGYRLATGLALGGIALAFALTTGLALTVRRQAFERTQLEADLRRSERLAALGKLLAGVAHEVRNPLAGIRSTAQLWQRGIVGLDEQSLNGLVHEVDRLEEIVSSLLQFSRADTQAFKSGDLNAVVAESARLASAPADSKAVRIEVELDRNLPPVAMSPPALLQVFRNLTTNAVHAMPTGGALRLSTRYDAYHRTVLATVTDNGPGLAPEITGHLFEPFFTTKPEGTGLGLAIAREIALAHRGDLRAANRTDGRGAVFTLSLPVELSNGNGDLV